MDIQLLRNDTTGTSHVNHLNNAGASLPPKPVVATMMQFFQLEAEIGGYEAFDQLSGQIAGFYQAVADLLHAEPHQIAFCGSATDAYARALSAIPWKQGDVILTTLNDYSSNQIAFLALEKRFGIRLVHARDLGSGGVDPEDFEKLICEHRPRLVAVTHVPTNSGLVQPVALLGEIIRRHIPEAWYLVDACQSVGQMALDVGAIKCDFLSATFRKFLRGPRGAGFLFASQRVLDAGIEMMLPDMRSAEWTAPGTYATMPGARRFEYWEMAPALVLGARTAVEYALNLGLEAIENRVRHLADYTRKLLAELPGVRVLDLGADLCGIATAYNKDWDYKTLVQHLHQQNINIRISPLTAAQIDFRQKGVEWAIRVSPHYYNLESEIDTLAAALLNLRKS